MTHQNHDSHTEPCRICGGSLSAVFEGEILQRIPVTYMRCDTCASLLLPSPSWLEESYSRVWTPDPDFGSLRRAAFIHRCIRRMRSPWVRAIPKRGRMLDVGVGRGLLLRLLLDDGHEAWGFDPYPHAVFGEDRISTTLSDASYDAISAIEVLEHTLDPIPFLRRLKDRLAPKGMILLSTELFDARKHGPAWPYLAPVHGQHITFFSHEGLHIAARAAGLEWVHSFRWLGQPFLHILVPQGGYIHPMKRWILQYRHWRGERRHRSDASA